jgi:hypothetical protein
VISLIQQVLFKRVSRDKHSLRRMLNVGHLDPKLEGTRLYFWSLTTLMVFVMISGVKEAMVRVDKNSLVLIPTQPQSTSSQVLFVSHTPIPHCFTSGHGNLSTMKEEGSRERTRINMQGQGNELEVTIIEKQPKRSL